MSVISIPLESTQKLSRVRVEVSRVSIKRSNSVGDNGSSMEVRRMRHSPDEE
jgi:hypothetical protein